MTTSPTATTAGRESLGYRQGPTTPLAADFLLTEHRITAPLDYRDESGSAENIEVFAREFRRPDAAAESLPWLVYLQGGPGFPGTRHTSAGGWIAAATKHFRVLQLDQRGTGLSTPLNRNTLAGSPEKMAETLRRFRADSIVRDAERLRRALGVEQWHTHGQSYGGFLTGTYLSLFPESLAGCMLTGGLPPLTAHVDDVYRATYSAVSRRQDEFFSWYPDDEDRLAAVYRRVRDHREMIDGHRIRPGHVQRLGMMLGGNTRVHVLHYLLSEAFEKRADGELGLTDAFKRAVWSQFSQETSPLYTVMHETIYAEHSPTSWSAWRVGREFSEFSEEAESPRLTGEMIYPWHVQTDPATSSLFEAADILAQDPSMGALYDREQLKKNTVPVAACVYTDDIYVDRGLSLSTADAIAGTQVTERSDLHHDGIAQDGAAIFEDLASMIGALQS